MEGRQKTKEFIFVILIVIFAGLFRIPSLTQPLGPDQGLISVIGEGLLNGELPYRDYWEMGSPLIFFTYALMFKIFGISMGAIPITDILVSMLTTFLIYLLAGLIWNRKVGYIGALLFAFFGNGVRLGMHAAGDTAFGTFWYIAQRETFMLPLIVTSLYLIISYEKNESAPYKYLLPGFLFGLIFVYKFPALIMFFCVLIYLNVFPWLIKTSKPRANLLQKNIALCSGFILSLVPFVLFFWIKGAMPEMADAIFKYVFSVYGQLEPDTIGIIGQCFRHTLFLAKENFILWIFFIASSIYIIFNDRNKENLLMVLWGLVSVIFIIIHREFFGYHYLIILPPFTILTGYGISKVFETKFNFRQFFTTELQKAFVILALIINIFFFTTYNYIHYTKFFYRVTKKISKEEYYDFFNAYPKHEYSFPADYKVAQYIEKNTNTNDMIYILGGIESVIHFLTKRKSPSRFIFSWIILSSKHGQVKQAESYRQELLDDLKTKIPKFIVTVEPLETFQNFSDLYHFISDNYILEKVFPDNRFVYILNQ